MPTNARFGIIAIAVLATLGPAATAQEDGKTTLRWKFKEGEARSYVMNQQVVMKMDMSGTEQSVTQNFKVATTWQTEKVEDDGKARVRLTYDRAFMKTPTPFGGELKFDTNDKTTVEGPMAMVADILGSMVGVPFTFTLSGTGSMEELELPEKFKAKLKSSRGALGGMISEDSIRQTLSQTFIPLPEDPIAKGESWKDHMQVSLPMGKMHFALVYTYLGSEKTGEKSLEKIAFKNTVSIEAAETPAQMSLKVKSQESNGTLYFDNKLGRLESSTTDVRLQLEIVLGTASMVQDMRTHLTLRTGAWEDPVDEKGAAEKSEKETSPQGGEGK